MATPAETLIQRRYSAGYCALEVTLQPLALSKWYPQPVVQDLQFQLWMQESASAEPVLLAEGDRPTLQSISQYVSQQIQTSLVIAHLNGSASASHSLQSNQANDLPKPSALQTRQPLSYLQLNDLASVLNQCEQSVRVLPVTLPIAKSPAHSASPEQNNVIAFPDTRRSPLRRKRTQVWAASSAAALLLAVGLTNLLRTDSQREQQMTASSSDRAETNAEVESVAPRIRPNGATDDESSDGAVATEVAPPNSNNTNSNNTNNTNRGEDAQQAAPSTRIGASPSTEDDSAITSDGQRARRANSPQIAANSSPSEAAPTAPTVRETEDRKDAIASNTTPSSMEQTPGSPPAVVETAPDIAADVPSELSLETPRENSAARADTAETPAAFTLDDLDTDESSPTAEASAAAQSRAELERETVRLQVKNYFQTQWQNRDELIRDGSISAPLSYELQLSETGEAISLTGLDEMASAYRDRLFPESSLPQFSPTANGLRLRIEILPNGQVLVSDR